LLDESLGVRYKMSMVTALVMTETPREHAVLVIVEGRWGCEIRPLVGERLAVRAEARRRVAAARADGFAARAIGADLYDRLEARAMARDAEERWEAANAECRW